MIGSCPGRGPTQLTRHWVSVWSITLRIVRRIMDSQILFFQILRLMSVDWAGDQDPHSLWLSYHYCMEPPFGSSQWFRPFSGKTMSFLVLWFFTFRLLCTVGSIYFIFTSTKSDSRLRAAFFFAVFSKPCISTFRKKKNHSEYRLKFWEDPWFEFSVKCLDIENISAALNCQSISSIYRKISYQFITVFLHVQIQSMNPCLVYFCNHILQNLMKDIEKLNDI